MKFWCERKTNNSPPHLRLWISWRGTPPILRLISDYAAEAHLQKPEQRRFQFGIFLFSSLAVLLYESSFNKVGLSQRRSYGMTSFWAWTWKLKVVSESALLWFSIFCGEMVLDLFYIFYSHFFFQKTCKGGKQFGQCLNECHLLHMRSFPGDSKQPWMLDIWIESKLQILRPPPDWLFSPLCICICKYSSSWLAICATLYWPFLQRLGTVAVGLL